MWRVSILALGVVGCASIVRSDRTFGMENGEAGPDAALTDAGDTPDAREAGGVPLYQQLAYLKDDQPAANDAFGYQMALDGERLAVASTESVEVSGTTYTNAGALYLYSHADSSSIVKEERLVSPRPQKGGATANVQWDLFPFPPGALTAALSGDTLVMGVGGEDDLPPTGSPVEDTGAAYVFHHTAGGWAETIPQRITGKFVRKDDVFGFGVALSGDTLAIAAPWDDSIGVDPVTNLATYDPNVANTGAVYVFQRNVTTDSWEQVDYLKADIPGNEDDFGESIALQGDLLVVGAPQTSAGGNGIGAVPAPSDTQNFQHAGAVYTFVRSGGHWHRDQYIKSTVAAPNVWFGESVALDKGTLVVGAPGKLNQVASEVDIYDHSTGAWLGPTPLSPEGPPTMSLFGHSVAISGSTVVVGAFQDASAARGVNGDPQSGGAPGSGAAYVFVRGARGWQKQAYLKASNASQGSGFGLYVAASGPSVAIAAPWEASAHSDPNQNDNGATYAGAVYTFGPRSP